jgi:hypothetical protein
MPLTHYSKFSMFTLRIYWLLDLSPADFRRFLTVPVDRRLLVSQCCLSTGLVSNGIRLTKRCIALSSRSDVTRGVLLADRYGRSRLAWCLARRGWNVRTWRKIRWSNESRFLLHVTDGCPKYALWDSNPGSWLVKEQKSRLRFGGRRLLLLNDEPDDV